VSNADDNQFSLKRSGDLWRLLAAITVNKLKSQIEFHAAAKRAIASEESLSDSLFNTAQENVAREPSPDEVACVIDEQLKERRYGDGCEEDG
jgi:RNA polymerase sigma-70 factor, ECF subfamily